MAAQKKLSGGIIAIAVINFVLAAFCLCGGLLGVAATAKPMFKLPQPPGQEEIVIPDMPEEVVTFSHAKGTVSLIEFVLIVAGGVGLLLLAPWGRLSTMTYAVLNIVASVVFTAYYLAVVSGPNAEWVAEVMAARGGAAPQQGVADMMGAMGSFGVFCVAVPLMVYSIVLLIVLTRPNVKRQFGPVEDDAVEIERIIEP